jgi:transposase
VAVALEGSRGDLNRVRRLGLDRFTTVVRHELPAWAATRPCLRMVRAVYAAAADPVGVLAQRPGALERAQLAMADWHDTRERLAQTETRMVAVLDDLGLTELVMTIAGLTRILVAALRRAVRSRPW